MTDPVLDLLLMVRDHRRQIAAGEVVSARALVTAAGEELARLDEMVGARHEAIERSSASGRPTAGQRIGGDQLRHARENRAQAEAALAFAVERRRDALRRLERAEAHLVLVQDRLRRAEISHEKISVAHDEALVALRQSADRAAEVETEDEFLTRWGRRR